MPSRLLLAVVSFSASARAPADAPTPARWATATQGGDFPLFGMHLAEVLNGEDAGLAVDPVATCGSCHSLALLESGRVVGNRLHPGAARYFAEIGLVPRPTTQP